MSIARSKPNNDLKEVSHKHYFSYGRFVNQFEKNTAKIPPNYQSKIVVTTLNMQYSCSISLKQTNI